MRFNGKLNIEIYFPIIWFVDTDVCVENNVREFLILKKSFHPEFSSFSEEVIDNGGSLYERQKVKLLNHINPFGGFKGGFFGFCYVEKVMKKVKILSDEELIRYGLKILNLNHFYFENTDYPMERWQDEFQHLSDREDILRYMFFFCKARFLSESGRPG